MAPVPARLDEFPLLFAPTLGWTFLPSTDEEKGEISVERYVSELLTFLSVEVAVLLTAATPIIELRGAIPVGISLGLSPLHSLFLSLLGSMIPVPIILLSIVPVFNHLKRVGFLRTFIEKITERSLRGNGEKIEKYGAWALVLIVAIPLPGTGVWSGSLIAALLNMRFRWAFPAIFAGNVIAGVLVAGLSYGAFSFFRP